MFFQNFYTQQSFEYTKGTCLIGYFADDTIWVAADQRLTCSTGQIFSDTTCKIFSNKNIIVAQAGIFLGYKYNISDIILEIISRQTTQKNIIDTIDQLLPLKLTECINDKIIEYNKMYKDIKELFKVNIGIIIASFVNNEPKLLSIYYLPTKIDSIISLSIAYRKCINLCNGHKIFLNGNHNKIDELINSKKINCSLLVPDLLISLIRFQSNYDPTVGKNITIMYMTRDGIVFKFNK